MSFTAIVTSHANPTGLRSTLGNLRYQTLPPDETIVLCSDTPDLLRLRENFPDVAFHERPNMEDWGHEKRAEGMLMATSRWLGFFNDDDSYSNHYIEKMMRLAAPGVDAVYCWWNERPNGCAFALGGSTTGNFIVRTATALAAGYKDRVYEADGFFIDRVSSVAREIEVVPEVLYFWNKQ